MNLNLKQCFFFVLLCVLFVKSENCASSLFNANNVTMNFTSHNQTMQIDILNSTLVKITSSFCNKTLDLKQIYSFQIQSKHNFSTIHLQGDNKSRLDINNTEIIVELIGIGSNANFSSLGSTTFLFAKSLKLSSAVSVSVQKTTLHLLEHFIVTTTGQVSFGFSSIVVGTNFTIVQQASKDFYLTSGISCSNSQLQANEFSWTSQYSTSFKYCTLTVSNSMNIVINETTTEMPSLPRFGYHSNFSSSFINLAFYYWSFRNIQNHIYNTNFRANNITITAQHKLYVLINNTNAYYLLTFDTVIITCDKFIMYTKGVFGNSTISSNSHIQFNKSAINSTQLLYISSQDVAGVTLKGDFFSKEIYLHAMRPSYNSKSSFSINPDSTLTATDGNITIIGWSKQAWPGGINIGGNYTARNVNLYSYSLLDSFSSSAWDVWWSNATITANFINILVKGKSKTGFSTNTDKFTLSAPVIKFNSTGIVQSNSNMIFPSNTTVSFSTHNALSNNQYQIGIESHADSIIELSVHGTGQTNVKINATTTTLVKVQNQIVANEWTLGPNIAVSFPTGTFTSNRFDLISSSLTASIYNKTSTYIIADSYNISDSLLHIAVAGQEEIDSSSLPTYTILEASNQTTAMQFENVHNGEYIDNTVFSLSYSLNLLTAQIDVIDNSNLCEHNGTLERVGYPTCSCKGFWEGTRCSRCDTKAMCPTGVLPLQSCAACECSLEGDMCFNEMQSDVQTGVTATTTSTIIISFVTSAVAIGISAQSVGAGVAAGGVVAAAGGGITVTAAGGVVAAAGGGGGGGVAMVGAPVQATGSGISSPSIKILILIRLFQKSSLVINCGLVPTIIRNALLQALRIFNLDFSSTVEVSFEDASALSPNWIKLAVIAVAFISGAILVLFYHKGYSGTSFAFTMANKIQYKPLKNLLYRVGFINIVELLLKAVTIFLLEVLLIPVLAGIITSFWIFSSSTLVNLVVLFANMVLLVTIYFYILLLTPNNKLIQLVVVEIYCYAIFLAVRGHFPWPTLPKQSIICYSIGQKLVNLIWNSQATNNYTQYQLSNNNSFRATIKHALSISLFTNHYYMELDAIFGDFVFTLLITSFGYIPGVNLFQPCLFIALFWSAYTTFYKVYHRFFNPFYKKTFSPGRLDSILFVFDICCTDILFILFICIVITFPTNGNILGFSFIIFQFVLLSNLLIDLFLPFVVIVIKACKKRNEDVDLKLMGISAL